MDISGVEAADDDDDEEEDEESQEVRIVPLDPEPDGGMDPALDALFEALSACAALNPDPGDEGGEEEDEEEEDEFDDPEDDDGAVVGLSGAEYELAERLQVFTRSVLDLKVAVGDDANGASHADKQGSAPGG